MFNLYDINLAFNLTSPLASLRSSSSLARNSLLMAVKGLHRRMVAQESHVSLSPCRDS